MKKKKHHTSTELILKFLHLSGGVFPSCVVVVFSHIQFRYEIQEACPNFSSCKQKCVKFQQYLHMCQAVCCFTPAHLQPSQHCHQVKCIEISIQTCIFKKTGMIQRPLPHCYNELCVQVWVVQANQTALTQKLLARLVSFWQGGCVFRILVLMICAYLARVCCFLLFIEDCSIAETCLQTFFVDSRDTLQLSLSLFQATSRAVTGNVYYQGLPVQHNLKDFRAGWPSHPDNVVLPFVTIAPCCSD